MILKVKVGSKRSTRWWMDGGWWDACVRDPGLTVCVSGWEFSF